MMVPAELLDRVRAAFHRQRPIDPDTNFFEAGLSSSQLVQVVADLGAVGLAVSLVDLYRYPTVRAVAAELAGRTAASAQPPAWTTARSEPMTVRDISTPP